MELAEIKAVTTFHGGTNLYPQELCVNFWVNSLEVGVGWDYTFLQHEDCLDYAG